MATRYGKRFRTRRGIYGRYKYVNGRRVAFVTNYSGRKVRNVRFKRKYRGPRRY